MLFFDDIASLRKVFEEASTQGVGIFLVREHGIFLVAGKADNITRDQAKNVTYANGCNPNSDKNWRDTARKLVGKNDFAHHLSVNSICLQILEHDAQLRAIVIGSRVILLCGKTTNLSLSEYRNLTDRLFTSAVAHFSASVTREEFLNWRNQAIQLLSQAAFTDCLRAKRDNKRKFLSANMLLHRRINCITIFSKQAETT